MKYSTSEAPVLEGALGLLGMMRFPAFRVNSGRIDRPGIHMQLAPAGTADIVGIVPRSGRFLAIECKRPKGGKRRPGQAEYLAMVRNNGGVGIFCRDLDTLAYVLDLLRSEPFTNFDEEGNQVP